MILHGGVIGSHFFFYRYNVAKAIYISGYKRKKELFIETFPSDVKVVCLENICYLSFIIYSIGVEHLTFFEALTI